MAYDNTCKYLAEKYPHEFARWLLSTDTSDILSACVQILAGLRFKKDLIRQLFREEIMQESVIYQDILLKGEQRGEQRGKKQEALELILRQLNRRFGVIEPEVKQQIDSLSLTDLEGLAESLLDFSRQNDLVNYLASLSPPQSKLEC